MRFDCGRNVDVGYYLAVNDYKRIVLKILAGKIECSRGSEYRRLLDRVFDLYAKIAAVTQGIDNRLRLVMQVYDNLGNAEFRDVFRHIADQRLAQKGYCRLCAVDRQSEQTCAEAP